MDIAFLIQTTQNRIRTLESIKDQAYQVGDIEQYNKADAELTQCQITVDRLKSLE